MNISYHVHDTVTADEFIDIIKRSGLNRPVDSRELMEKMVENANLIITARDSAGKLIGIGRSVTDFAYCCYLSCLAVDKQYQRKNIGTKIIEKTIEVIGENAILLLISAPGVEDYYKKIGFEISDKAFIVHRGEKQKIFLNHLKHNSNKI